MNKYKSLLALVFIVNLVLNGFVVYKFIENREFFSSNNKFKKDVIQYPYLSKRVLVENKSDILLNFLALRKKIDSTTDPWGEDFTMYFEYLPTGISIGRNSNQEFIAASLFKVPVVMAYYRYLERTGLTDEQELIIRKDDLDQNFGNLWEKGEGHRVKANTAVELALENSDNTAINVIANEVNTEDFSKVYTALDLDLNLASEGAVMTSRNYSTILKALYFSAVLDKVNSNKILNMLTKSDFNEKIIAGIDDKSIKVAHKIGDYRSSGGETAFYDCGIIYLPKRPYLLCMTSIGDENTANKRMSQVSKIVYDYVTTAK